MGAREFWVILCVFLHCTSLILFFQWPVCVFAESSADCGVECLIDIHFLREGCVYSSCFQVV